MKAKLKKFWYYFDEFLTLFFTFIGVLISSFIHEYNQGRLHPFKGTHLNWFTIGISAVISIISYGMFHTNLNYNEDKKPPLIKRLATALFHGISYRTLLGMTE